VPVTPPDTVEEARASASALAARILAAEGGGAGEATDERSCRSLLAELAAARLLGFVVPAPWGGRGEGVATGPINAVREQLAYASGLLDLMFVMQGLGSYPITHAGSESQKGRYLPAIAAGTSVAAFAVTEPEAGSDVGAIQTRARRDGDHYVLDGIKTFISNAPFADTITVIARTAEGPEAKGRSALSAFVVEGAAKGLSRRADLDLIAPHPIGTLEFRGCEVPAGNLLGKEGDGFAIAMATLDRFRPTVGAAAIGFAQRALDEAVAYARGRVQFGRPIAEFEGIQFKLADMATRIEAARLLVDRAAASADRPAGAGAGYSLSPLPESASRDASMAKLFATETAAEVADEAVQIHGGRGLIRGCAVERIYREVRALRIYEGTSEIQRTIIGRSLIQR
jgi:acyl-CoA dehydrogenase